MGYRWIAKILQKSMSLKLKDLDDSALAGAVKKRGN